MSSLRDALGQRILVLDGAMGTMIQAAGLTAADFGGPAYEGCNEHLNLTRPDVIRRIHAAYLDAGADIISNVLVDIMSAPASRYAAWIPRTTSGRVRVRCSLQPSYAVPPKSAAVSPAA